MSLPLRVTLLVPCQRTEEQKVLAGNLRSIRPCLVGGTRQRDDGIGTFATIPQVLRLLG